MKTIASLSLLALAGLIYAAAATEEKSSVPVVARNISAEMSPLEQKEKAGKFKIEIVPTYGPSGSPRPATFIEGESPCFMFTITDLAGKGEMECILIIEVFDDRGNTITNYPHSFISQDRFVFGGSSYSQPFAIEPTKAGKFTVKVRLIHPSSGKSDDQELPIEVLPKETFGAIIVRFSHDANGTSYANGNLTVGELIYGFNSVNGFSVKNNRVHLRETLTILDHNKQNVREGKSLSFDFDQALPENYQGKPILHFDFTPTRPGIFYAHIELKDCIVDKTITYDVPIKVSLPPGMEEEKQ